MLKTIVLVLLSYLIGSVSWGLVIGKLFYHTDIRKYGSGNLGGTNAGRVLGTPVGILVILLDGLKALLAMWVCHIYSPGSEKYVGLAVCLGHCFPVFAGFRGGKAVATAYGYLLGLAIYVTRDFLLTFFCPIIIFFAVLAISRIVSLSSMISVVSAAVLIFLFADREAGILVFLLSLFIIYRHKSNIERIKNGTESKIGPASRKN